MRGASLSRYSETAQFAVRWTGVLSLWLEGSLALLLLRQRKHVERVSARRIVNVGQNRARDVARAPAAEACRYGDVLFAANAERYGKALHRRAKARLPQRFAGVDVDGAKDAVEVADEGDAAGGRENGGEKGRALLHVPYFLHRLHIEGGEAADVAVGSWHFVKQAVAHGSARAVDELHFAAGHFHAALAERDDQPLGGGIVAHGLPVVAALGAGAHGSPLADFLFEYVGAVREFSRLLIHVENVLK